ncbi:MAG: hypothetical protein WCC00_14995 [Candidatus Aminicenantales bacterium]
MMIRQPLMAGRRVLDLTEISFQNLLPLGRLAYGPVSKRHAPIGPNKAYPPPHRLLEAFQGILPIFYLSVNYALVRARRIVRIKSEQLPPRIKRLSPFRLRSGGIVIPHFENISVPFRDPLRMLLNKLEGPGSASFDFGVVPDMEIGHSQGPHGHDELGIDGQGLIEKRDGLFGFAAKVVSAGFDVISPGLGVRGRYFADVPIDIGPDLFRSYVQV